MKTRALLLLASLLLGRSMFAQGTVAFANSATTLLTTNDFVISGNLAPSGQYRIGLYAGPAGNPTNNLTLIGLATNSALGGRFSGGNPFTLPTVPGLYDGSVAIAFQIRAWSLADGLNYDDALAYRQCFGGYVGVSALGSVTPNPPGSVAPTPVLFGTNPGNVSGFALYANPDLPVCPEPSTYALALLGSAAFALVARRRKRSLR